ncbi:MAG: hypothetical protein ACYTCU_01705, partial [Planctomycetota bacterium]
MSVSDLHSPTGVRAMLQRARRSLLAPLALVAVLPATAPHPAPPAPVPPPAVAPDGSGFARFLEKQTKAAQMAMRKKDHETANAAWLSVLELDPSSMVALTGLADIARSRDDADAEVFWRTELNDVLELAIAGGDRKSENALRKSAERLAQIDPFAGQAEELLAAYGAAQYALAEAYLADQMHANALVAMQRHVRLLPPGSVGAEEAQARIRNVLREAP